MSRLAQVPWTPALTKGGREREEEESAARRGPFQTHSTMRLEVSFPLVDEEAQGTMLKADGIQPHKV